VIKWLLSLVFFTVFLSTDSLAQGSAQCGAQCLFTNDCDGDGYTNDGSGKGLDCDDNDRGIVEGSAEEINGVRSRCVGGAWVPVTGLQYFVDCDLPTNGNGSAASPYNTACCIDQFTNDQCPGQNTVSQNGDLVGGTTVWVKGQCNALCDQSSGQGSIAIRQNSGSPGNLISILADPTGTTDFANQIYLDRADYIEVVGFTRTNKTGQSMRCQGGNFVQFYDNYFENNTTNTGGPNDADIYVSGCDNSNFDNNTSIDFHGVGAAVGNENVAGIVLFSSNNNTTNYNYITQPSTATCGNDRCCAIKYKHGSDSPGGGEIAYNYIEDVVCGILGSQQGIAIHHNYINDFSGVGIAADDSGGPAYTAFIDIHDNTLVGTGGRCTDIRPQESYGLEGPFSITDNRCLNPSGAIWGIGQFGTDPDFNSFVNDFGSTTDIDRNCVSPTTFQFFNGSPPATGGSCSFADWQGTSNPDCPIGFDPNSIAINNSLDVCGCTTGTGDICETSGYCERLEEKTITVSSNDTLLGEPGNDGEITFTLSEPAPAGGVTVSINVGGCTPPPGTGGGCDGIDYSFPSNPLVIPEGTTTITFPVSVIDDMDIEGNEVFSLTVGTVLPTDCVLQGGSSLDYVIEDDDPTDTTTTTTLPGSSNTTPWWDRNKPTRCRFFGWFCR